MQHDFRPQVTFHTDIKMRLIKRDQQKIRSNASIKIIGWHSEINSPTVTGIWESANADDFCNVGGSNKSSNRIFLPFDSDAAPTSVYRSAFVGVQGLKVE